MCLGRLFLWHNYNYLYFFLPNTLHVAVRFLLTTSESLHPSVIIWGIIWFLFVCLHWQTHLSWFRVLGGKQELIIFVIEPSCKKEISAGSPWRPYHSTQRDVSLLNVTHGHMNPTTTTSTLLVWPVGNKKESTSWFPLMSEWIRLMRANLSGNRGQAATVSHTGMADWTRRHRFSMCHICR